MQTLKLYYVHYGGESPEWDEKETLFSSDSPEEMNKRFIQECINLTRREIYDFGILDPSSLDLARLRENLEIAFDIATEFGLEDKVFNLSTGLFEIIGLEAASGLALRVELD